MYGPEQQTFINSFDGLIVLYPALYDVSFTFCVPDSWVEILDSLSSQIDSILAQNPDYSIEINDVKEKYNNLAFYYSLSGPAELLDEVDKQIEELIDHANYHIQTINRFKRGR